MSKTRTFPIRVSETELAHWTEEAERQGVSVAELIRRKMGFIPPAQPISEDDLPRSPKPHKAHKPRSPFGLISGTYKRSDLCGECQRKGLSCETCRKKFAGRKMV